MATDWPFDQPRNAAAKTTVQVLMNGSPILQVTHYEADHSWTFLCGTTASEKDGRMVAMEEAVELDPTLLEIAELPPGWSAWRKKVGSQWNRKPI